MLNIAAPAPNNWLCKFDEILGGTLAQHLTTHRWDRHRCVIKLNLNRLT